MHSYIYIIYMYIQCFIEEYNKNKRARKKEFIQEITEVE